MPNCENCIIAAEMRETRSIVEHLVAETAATRTAVEGMEKTLLGNGQPGRCAEHEERIAKVERWRSWLAGALAVLSVLWAGATAVFAAVIVEKLKKG